MAGRDADTQAADADAGGACEPPSRTCMHVLPGNVWRALSHSVEPMAFMTSILALMTRAGVCKSQVAAVQIRATAMGGFTAFDIPVAQVAG